jgi:hypothetical protein
METGDRADLERFWVRHQTCQGQVQVLPPGEADLTDTGGVWLSMRCDGCGQSIRREFDYMGVLRSTAIQAGMTAAEFDALAERDDGPEQIEKRLQAWPGLVPMLLARLRRAQGGDPLN